MNIRFYFLYIIAFLKRYGYRLTLFVVLLAILIVGFFYLREQTNNRVISQGVVGTYTANDLTNVSVFSNLISEGLVKIDEKGSPVANLVSEWEVNKEANLYKFKLRENLKWADGKEVKASDILLILAGAEVTTPDDRTIQFKLVDSFSPLPMLLTKPIFRKNDLMGMGPYMVGKVLYSNTDNVFVGKIFLKSNKEELPEIILRFYPSEKLAKSALKVGEIQSLLGVSEVEDITNQKTFSNYSKVNFSRLVSIFYNTKDPILADENFRLALSFGTSSIDGEQEAKTSIPPHSWAYNDEVKDFLDNPNQAKSYLEKVKNGRDSTITLTTVTPLRHVGEKIVEEWKKLGVKAVLRVESGIPQNFQALLIPYDLPVDPADQYALWHSTQLQTNISKFSFVRIDKDLEDARKTSDLEIRKARYADFQRILLDRAPATFLYFPRYNVVYLNKVERDLKPILELQLRSL